MRSTPSSSRSKPISRRSAPRHSVRQPARQSHRVETCAGGCRLALTRIQLRRFTAFEELDLEFSPGINVLVGANGTGKTHLMKVAYAACDVTKSKLNFGEKLVRTFLPSKRLPGRLVKRRGQSSRCSIRLYRDDVVLGAGFSNHTETPDAVKVSPFRDWMSDPVDSVYIPVKEMLANAPGFRSLYAQRELHIEEVYADILDRAFLPTRRGPTDKARKQLLTLLEKALDGKVTVKNEEFFLRNRQGNLEFSLLAEGIRKLGLLWLLIQNGTVLSGTVLFWDEPETNLNPKLFGTVVEILLELQREGVQIFLATHDYVILKERDLRTQPDDHVTYHALHRPSQTREIMCHSTSDYLSIEPNAIADAFGDLYDREVQRSLGGMDA